MLAGGRQRCASDAERSLAAGGGWQNRHHSETAWRQRRENLPAEGVKKKRGSLTPC